MGRPPRREDDNTDVKKGPWTLEENKKLVDYIQEHGHRNWKALPKLAGLNRCGKSCRLRWVNYLRPGIKRGGFDEEEEEMIIQLHSKYGNKWSVIATHLPGRTDNEIKNYWNTNLRKKLLRKGIDPATHCARPDLILVASILSSCTGLDAGAARVQASAVELVRMQLAQSIIQAITCIPSNPLLTNDLGLGPDRTQSHVQVAQTGRFGYFNGNSGSSPQHSGTDSVQSLCSPSQEMRGVRDDVNEMFQISHDNINIPASSDYSGTDIYGTWDQEADLGEIFSNDFFPEGFFNYGL